MSEKNRARADEPTSPPFRVGEWLVEPSWNRIRRSAETVKLEPRVMRLLATLAAAAGKPVTRRELLDAVWPGVLVNEEALSRAVSQLRRALGDDSRTPRYVETVQKGGYCLIAPVTTGPAEATPPKPAPTPNARRSAWPVLAIVSAVLVASLLYWRVDPSPSPDQPRPLVPLTSEPGREIDPAVSPDGKRVAYLASSGGGYDLFVRGIDAAAPVRLTRDALAKGHPCWSPDGQRIAYVAASGSSAGIYLLSLRGGGPAKLVDLPSWSFGLDWSPDGRTLAYSDTGLGDAPVIVLLDIASKTARPIAPSASSAADTKPVFSPDGKGLAFIRNDQLERQQIAVVDLQNSSDAKLLGASPQQIRGVDWAPGGDDLIFSAKSGRRFSLWRIAASGDGAAEALAVEGGDLFNPSVSGDGRLVVEEVEQDRDVWRIEFGRNGAAPLVRSTFDDYDPVYSPTGTRLAFVSERSGAPEIWIRSAAGQVRPVTSLGGPDIGHLSWSSDGTRLAFLAEKDGVAAIYAAQASGGKAVRLLQATRGEIPIGWAGGGDRLIVLVPGGGEWRIEDVLLAKRQRSLVSDLPVNAAAVGGDGQSIFAVPSGENLLLRIVRGQGIVRQFRLPPSVGGLSALLPAGDAVYLVKDTHGTAIVHQLDLHSGRVREVGRFDYFAGGRLTVAPDGRSIAYARARETANDLAWTRL